MNDWLATRRASAQAALEGVALPTADLEVWRYSPIDDLDLARYQPVAAPQMPTPRSTTVRSYQPTRAALVIVRDDRVVHLEVNAAGVSITPFADLDGEPADLGEAINSPTLSRCATTPSVSVGCSSPSSATRSSTCRLWSSHDVTVDGSVTYRASWCDAATSSQVDDSQRRHLRRRRHAHSCR